MAEIKAEQVPEAVWRALGQELGFIQHRNAYCKAIAAAIEAWPGMHLGAPWVIGVPNATSIILPLEQEASDD